MKTVIRATSTAQFLSLVPSLCGFTPRESLVVIAFRRGHTHGVLRLDLPPHDTDFVSFAAETLGMLCRLQEVDAAALVAYVDTQLGTDGPLPHGELIGALRKGLERCGFALFDALCVGTEAWARYREDGGVRHSLASIPAAPNVPGVGDVRASQNERSALPTVDAELRDRVRAAFAVLEEVGPSQATDDADADEKAAARLPPASGASAESVPRLIERAVTEEADAAAVAALAWLLNKPMFRDVALVQWASEQKLGATTLWAQIAFAAHGASVPEALGEVLMGRAGRPDPERLRLALSRVLLCAACLDGRARVGSLVAATWLAWALGQCSLAGGYLDQALAIEPGHSMAKLLHAMLGIGHLPEWVYERAAA